MFIVIIIIIIVIIIIIMRPSGGPENGARPASTPSVCWTKNAGPDLVANSSRAKVRPARVRGEGHTAPKEALEFE